MYGACVQACHLLADWGEVQQLKQLCYLARGHPLIGEDKAKVDDLNVMCATACIMDGDRQNGYVFAKNVCLKVCVMFVYALQYCRTVYACL